MTLKSNWKNLNACHLTDFTDLHINQAFFRLHNLNRKEQYVQQHIQKYI